MQCSVHLPTPFLSQHTHQLLPEWACDVASVLVVLQQATCALVTPDHQSETQKNVLREQFLQMGTAIAAKLHTLGCAADFFDPKTGCPFFSRPGTLALDDVAVISACLNYPRIKIQDCTILLHPEWGTAVYPSILLSSAKPALLELVTKSCLDRGGSVANPSWRFRRSEYHHSFMG